MKRFISIVLSAVIALSLASTAFASGVKGDVNDDGKTTSEDALYVLQYSVGIDINLNKTKADVNKDKQINSADALEILKICVGISPAFDIPTSTADIVSLYNQALKSTYFKEKMTLKYNYVDSGVTADLTAKTETPFKDTVSKTYECQNGAYKLTGTKIEMTNPGYTLDSKGVKSAKINENSDGTYTVTLVLVEERTDIFKFPVYNKQAAIAFIYTDEATSGTSYYSGTTLKLTINSSGDAVALDMKMPYICDYKSKIGGKTHTMRDTGSTDYTATYTF